MADLARPIGSADERRVVAHRDGVAEDFEELVDVIGCELAQGKDPRSPVSWSRPAIRFEARRRRGVTEQRAARVCEPLVVVLVAGEPG